MSAVAKETDKNMKKSTNSAKSVAAKETDKNMNKSTNGAKSVAAKSEQKSSGVQYTVTTSKTSNTRHVDVSVPDKAEASANVGSKATSIVITAAEQNLQPEQNS